MTRSVGRIARWRLPPRILLDLRGVEQRRDDCRRPDTNRNARLNQLGSPFFIAVIVVAHHVLSIWKRSSPYAVRGGLGSAG